MWMLDLQLGLARAWADTANAWLKAGADAMSAASRAGATSPSTPFSWPMTMLPPFSQPVFNPFQALTAAPFPSLLSPAQGATPWSFTGLPGAWTWTPSAPWPAVSWSFPSPWAAPVNAQPNPMLEMSKLFLPLMALPAAFASAMAASAKAAAPSVPRRSVDSSPSPSASFRSAGGHASTAVIVTPFDVARSMSAFWSFEPMSGRKPH